MKKLILLSILLIAMFASTVSANIIATEYSYAASGSTEASVTLDDQSAYQRYEIYSIIADSDLSTALLSIQKADEAGVTTSYTTVFTLPQSNSSTYSYIYKNDGEPIFIGDRNYRYKIIMSSTTSNSLIVGYGKQ